MDTPDHAEREHSEHGGSIVSRYWNCPASVRLARTAPPRVKTIHSERGTAAHEVAESCLRSGQDAESFVGRVVNGVEVDPEIADGVQIYLDAIRAHIGVTILPSALMIEVRFDLSPLKPPAPMFGTCDCVFYVPVWRKLYVFDYKNGWLHVPASTPQLKFYALGAVVALGAGKPVTEVEVCVVQPHGIGAPVRTATYSAEELAEWSVELFDRVVATLEPNAPAEAGEWCKFCPVAGTCATRAAVRLADAQAEFADVVGVAPLPALPALGTLTPAQLGRVQSMRKGIITFLDDVEAAIAAGVQRGESGYGHKLVPNRPSSTWRDDDDAAVMLESVYGVEPFKPRETISPAQARDAVKAKLYAEAVERHAAHAALNPLDKAKKPTKKAAEEIARENLADLIRTASTGLVLVPDDDPRNGVLAATEEFAGLTYNPEE